MTEILPVTLLKRNLLELLNCNQNFNSSSTETMRELEIPKQDHWETEVNPLPNVFE